MLSDNTADTDKNLEMVTEIIYKAANKSLRKKSVHPKKIGKDKNRGKKWFTQDLYQSRTELRLLAKELDKNPFNRELRHRVSSTRMAFNKQVKKAKREHTDQLLKKLDNMHEKNPNEYWALIEELKNDDLAKTSTETPFNSNEWNAYFKNLYGKNDNQLWDNEIKDQLKDLERNTPNSDFLNAVITEEEVKNSISSLKNKKATGLDNISAEMLKSGINHLSPCFTKLFNSILNSKTYPENWRYSTISAIHKKGPKNIQDNYRGIALSSIISKVFGKVINERIIQHLDEKNLRNEFQIGFKKKARTSDHMFVIKCLTDKYTKNGKLYLCFIDFKKAFDTVWRKGILLKLLQNGISGPVYEVLKNMYENVYLGAKCPSPSFFKSYLGTKQGAVESPTLFNICLLYTSPSPRD